MAANADRSAAMTDSLKQRVLDDVKAAMRARDKERLGALRLIVAAVKQVEVDERLDMLEDARVLGVLQKMIKQRRDSIEKFESANRQDLADKEAFEISVIQAYMPQPLKPEELDQLISTVIAETGAVSMKDMGKVMGRLKNQVQGRADMGAVSTKVKHRLASSG